MISTESNKKSLVSRRVEMFGELAKDNTINRSRHLSESNIQNAQSDKLIEYSSSTHQTPPKRCIHPRHPLQVLPRRGPRGCPQRHLWSRPPGRGHKQRQTGRRAEAAGPVPRQGPEQPVHGEAGPGPRPSRQGNSNPKPLPL